MQQKRAHPNDFQLIREGVMSWLEAEGYTLQDISGQDLAWAVSGTHETGGVVHVAQRRIRPDIVNLQAPLTIGGINLKEVLAEKAQELQLELAREVNPLGLDFAFRTDEEQQVIVYDHIYWESTTQNEFAKTVKRLRHGLAAILRAFKSTLGQSPSAASGRTMEPPIGPVN